MSFVERLRLWLSAGELEDGREVTKLMRRGQLIVLVGFIGVGLWAAFAPVDGAVVANGVVKVSGSRKTVQHAEGGIVQKILVRNGDVVKAGDVLVELKDLRTDAGASLLDAQWAIAAVKAARLEAERVEAERIVLPAEVRKRAKSGETQAAIQREQALFAARRRSLLESLALIATQIRDTGDRIAGLEQQIAAQLMAARLAQDELDSYEKLGASGAVSQSQLLAARRRQADYEVRIGEHRADLASARQSATDLALRRQTLRSDYRDQASRELVQVEEQLVELRERLRPTNDAAARLRVTASVDGIVVNLQVHTIGGVIRPGEPLMDIVPADAPLLVEARIPLEAISQVFPGQDSHIQFTSFRQRVTPMVDGTVTYVSADMLQDAQSQVNYYLVNVVADAASLKHAGIDRLLPGMPAVAYVRTRPRSMLEYMFEPVYDSMNRAFREQ